MFVLSFILVMGALLVGGLGLLIRSVGKEGDPALSATETSGSSSGKQESSKELALTASRGDWELVLVNRDHPKEEMDPQVISVEGVQVDRRIESKAREFLAAARQIDPNEHLISGYRSVAYQNQLYESYIQEEMASRGISHEAAEKVVQTYSQPPGASEHQTGLAIDMSTVDALNQSDPEEAKQVQALAPKYGFVLRFPSDKQAVTGVDYEDWHYRYVGLIAAKYMADHHLTLEEYLKRLGN